ncbi:MAG: 30S ribosomal protein S5 [Candidatus Pacebacteria bacterium]|nr:30S ribosomal protein S5 [Candidatus Paceibacterota bacterium]
MDTQNPTTPDVPATPVAPAPTERPSRGGDRGADRGGFSKNPRRKSRPRAERPKSEYDQRIIGIRRVTRVVAGGRRFSFSVVVVAGNHKGAVGVGTGKAGDTALAVEKAYRTAVKHKIQIPLTETSSIAHDVEAKYSSGRVMLYPLPGRGLVAGGSVRDVLELAGVKDIGAKILSPSKNKLNNAQAAIKALGLLMPQSRRVERKPSK